MLNDMSVSIAWFAAVPFYNLFFNLILLNSFDCVKYGEYGVVQPYINSKVRKYIHFIWYIQASLHLPSSIVVVLSHPICLPSLCQPGVCVPGTFHLEEVPRPIAKTLAQR